MSAAPRDLTALRAAVAAAEAKHFDRLSEAAVARLAARQSDRLVRRLEARRAADSALSGRPAGRPA